MIGEAQVVLIKFPHTDAGKGKLRPALVLKRLPGIYDDWLVCMISTQLRQFEPELDESISPTDGDFEESGLHSESIIKNREACSSRSKPLDWKDRQNLREPL